MQVQVLLPSLLRNVCSFSVTVNTLPFHGNNMGSIPVKSMQQFNERVTEWLKVTHCKCVGESYRWFESNLSQNIEYLKAYMPSKKIISNICCKLSYNLFKFITDFKNLVLVQSKR